MSKPSVEVGGATVYVVVATGGVGPVAHLEPGGVGTGGHGGDVATRRRRTRVERLVPHAVAVSVEPAGDGVALGIRDRPAEWHKSRVDVGCAERVEGGDDRGLCSGRHRRRTCHRAHQDQHHRSQRNTSHGSPPDTLNAPHGTVRRRRPIGPKVLGASLSARSRRWCRTTPTPPVRVVTAPSRCPRSRRDVPWKTFRLQGFEPASYRFGRSGGLPLRRRSGRGRSVRSRRWRAAASWPGRCWTRRPTAWSSSTTRDRSCSPIARRRAVRLRRRRPHRLLDRPAPPGRPPRPAPRAPHPVPSGAGHPGDGIGPRPERAPARRLDLPSSDQPEPARRRRRALRHRRGPRHHRSRRGGGPPASGAALARLDRRRHLHLRRRDPPLLPCERRCRSDAGLQPAPSSSR